MSSFSESASSATRVNYLLRISEVFAPLTGELLTRFGAASSTELGPECLLINTSEPEAVTTGPCALFVRWKLRIDHSWPCNPARTEGFIERAAQALWKKFGHQKIQGVFVGTLNPGSTNPYFKKMASNLRGRLLVLFPRLTAPEPEAQDPNVLTLFCLVGRGGLFCGVQTPKECNGFYPGGGKHVATDTPDSISRAGAKIVEALHYLGLHRPPLPERSHWLELGASPGGMTMELLKRGYKVTAVDRAPLDARLRGHLGLRFFEADVRQFEPPSKLPINAILCDMNGLPQDSLATVARLAGWATPAALVIFTLKLPRLRSVAEALEMVEAVLEQATKSGLRLLAGTHLVHNRLEFTLLFETQASQSEAAMESAQEPGI